MIKNVAMLICCLMLIAGCATVRGVKEDVSGLFNKGDDVSATEMSTSSTNEDKSEVKKKVETKKNQQPCINNFSVDGNFFIGRQYKSYQDFSGVSKNVAFTKIIQHLASSGLKIVSSDKESGIISASQDVIRGKGASVPINVVIKDQGKSLHIETSLRLSGGHVTSEDLVQEEFCKIFAAVK